MVVCLVLTNHKGPKGTHDCLVFQHSHFCGSHQKMQESFPNVFFPLTATSQVCLRHVTIGLSQISHRLRQGYTLLHLECGSSSKADRFGDTEMKQTCSRVSLLSNV